MCESLGGVGGRGWLPEVEELIGPTPPVPILLVADEVYDEGGEAEEAKRVDGGGVGHEDGW